jgi:hypothetical protein
MNAPNDPLQYVLDGGVFGFLRGEAYIIGVNVNANLVADGVASAAHPKGASANVHTGEMKVDVV